MKPKSETDKLIEDFLELHVELYIEGTLACNEEQISKKALDEDDMLKVSESWGKKSKYRSYTAKLIKLGYNPYAMGARHVEKLYKSGDLKRAIDKDTREIKFV